MAQNREYEIIIYSNFSGSILTLWAKLQNHIQNMKY